MLSEDAMLRWVRHMWRQRSDWLPNSHDGRLLSRRTWMLWKEIAMLTGQTGRRLKVIEACSTEHCVRLRHGSARCFNTSCPIRSATFTDALYAF
jgi:hypothetical protein